MDCAQLPLTDEQEFLLRFNQKVGRGRVPLGGTLDLTHRCNLDCVHCYLGPHRGQAEERPTEMTTQQVKHIIDEFTAAGCLTLLITGGEPLLRPDFGAVYRHAREAGLLVSVFTNGTLVSDRVLEAFVAMPPQVVEVTVYGATAPTYERITGVPGSFERCLRGIRRLSERGVKVNLKTVLMTLNLHEFDSMKKLASSMGLGFRSDAAIFPRLNGDRAPLALRVAPELVVQTDMADEKTRSEWREYLEKRPRMPASESLYTCGAGLTNFHIDPYGRLHPCVMSRDYEYDLNKGSFIDGWDGVISRIRDERVCPDYECNRCQKRTLCGLCPSFSRAENGNEQVRSDYLCTIGNLRYNAIGADSGRS